MRHEHEMVVAELAELTAEQNRAFGEALDRTVAAAPAGPTWSEGLLIACQREAGLAVKAGSPIAPALTALAQTLVDNMTIAGMVRHGL